MYRHSLLFNPIRIQLWINMFKINRDRINQFYVTILLYALRSCTRTVHLSIYIARSFSRWMARGSRWNCGFIVLRWEVVFVIIGGIVDHYLKKIASNTRGVHDREITDTRRYDFNRSFKRLAETEKDWNITQGCRRFPNLVLVPAFDFISH